MLRGEVEKQIKKRTNKKNKNEDQIEYKIK